MRTITICTALGAGLLIAGCGGANTPQNPTNASGGVPKDGIQAAYRFSACMRNHGVTSFPDPIVHSSGTSTSVGLRVDPSETSSPSFKSAQQACQHILPAPSPSQVAAQEHTHELHMLSFARCMRARGVTDFPDPDNHGNITPATLSAAGIDIHAPALEQAAIACVPSSHGDLTAGQIRQAIASH
jgi:hypothetical protein